MLSHVGGTGHHQPGRHAVNRVKGRFVMLRIADGRQAAAAGGRRRATGYTTRGECYVCRYIVVRSIV